MWKLWHWLFGWEYVAVSFWSGMEARRVHTSPKGNKYVQVGDNIIFLDDTDRKFRELT